MPFMKSKSNQAVKKNMESEMDAGNNKKPSLAIAFSVQRKNKKKKMADGGMANPKPSTDIHTEAQSTMDDISSGIDKRMRDKQAQGKPGYALGGAIEGQTHSKPYSRNPGTPASKSDNTRLPGSETMSGDMGAPIGSTPRGLTVTISKAEYDALRSGGAYAMGGPVNPSLSQSMAAKRMPMDMDEEFDENPHATSIADAIRNKRKMANGGVVDLEENSEEEGSTPYDSMNAKAGNEEQYDDSQLEDQPEDSNEMGDDREESEEDQHDMISKIRSRMKSHRG